MSIFPSRASTNACKSGILGLSIISCEFGMMLLRFGVVCAKSVAKVCSSSCGPVRISLSSNSTELYSNDSGSSSKSSAGGSGSFKSFLDT